MSNPVPMCHPAAADPQPAPPARHVLPPARGLRGQVVLPAAPDAALLALALAALAAGRSELSNLPDAAEVHHMAAALRGFGAAVTPLAPGAWRIAGRGIGGLAEPPGVLQAGASETLAGLLCALAAGHPLFAVLAAAPGLCLGPLLRALSATGARCQGRAGQHPPVAIEGAADPLPGEAAAPRALAAPLLLAGLAARGTTRLRLPGAAPHPAEALLRLFGAAPHGVAETGIRHLALPGQPELRPGHHRLPPDPLAAAAALLAALLVPGSVLTAEGADPALLAGFRALGAGLDGATASHSLLRGATLPAEALPDGALPLLATACAFAHGPSRLRGAAADPTAAATLALLGDGARQDGADLILAGTAPPAGGTIPPSPEHGITMSAWVIGLAAPRGARITGYLPASLAGLGA